MASFTPPTPLDPPPQVVPEAPPIVGVGSPWTPADGENRDRILDWWRAWFHRVFFPWSVKTTDDLNTWVVDASEYIDLHAISGYSWRKTDTPIATGGTTTVELTIAQYHPIMVGDLVSDTTLESNYGRITSVVDTTHADVEWVGSLQGEPGPNTIPTDSAVAALIDDPVSDTIDSLYAWAPYTNAKQYGAKGDGITNDTAEINTAIQATPAGGVCLIPAGVYMIDADYGSDGGGGTGSLYMKTGVTLQLDGTLKAITNAKDSYAIIRALGQENWAIVGTGTIQGDRDTHTGVTGEFGMGVSIGGGENILISGITIKNCWGDGIYVGLNEATPDTEVANLRVVGIALDNNRRNGTSVVAATQVTFTGCIITRTNGTSPEAGIDLEPNGANTVSDITVTGNTFKDNARSGVVVATGSKQCAVDGNTFSGTHTNAAIQCNGANTTITGNVVTPGSAIGIYVNTGGKETTVTGNVVKGTTGIGISLKNGVDGTLVAANTISDTAGAGIAVSGAQNVVITGNTISRNSDANGSGIGLIYSSSYPSSACIVTGNIIADVQRFGIYVTMPDTVISDNLIIGASTVGTGVDDAINLSSPADSTRVKGNTIRPSSAGIQVRFGIYIGSGVTRTWLDNNDLTGARATGDVQNLGTGTDFGRLKTGIGALKEGFFGSDPISQETLDSGATTTQIVAALTALGLTKV